jgi:RNA-binding protein YhbY
MDKKLKEMRSESKKMPASILIGKNGITDSALANIHHELVKYKFVKIKILPSYISDKNKEDVFKELMEKTGANIVNKLGFTITLTKR